MVKLKLRSSASSAALASVLPTCFSVIAAMVVPICMGAGSARAETTTPNTASDGAELRVTDGDAPGGAAHAQVASESSPSALGEIIVTARKRNESEQSVPVAITALTPAQIAKYDINSLERLAATSSDLQVTRAPFGSGAEITMRGIGSSFLSAGIDQSTAIVVDGTYYGQGRVINDALFDLGGIQVLRGPQALFFGKNVSLIANKDPSSPRLHFTRISPCL